MSSIGYEDRDDPSYRSRVLIKSKLVDLLSDPDAINWNDVESLLHQLPVSDYTARCSTEDDPMGRLLLGSILAKNPPATTVRGALAVFPDALMRNPAAFFTACNCASSDILAIMMRHNITVSRNDECPYPWILSPHVPLEAAQTLLTICPDGVLQESSCLSGFNPLDYFLMSSDMIEQRNFDITLWNKFKLMLLAAEYCFTRKSTSPCLSPIRVILERILSSRGECSILLVLTGILRYL